MHYHPRDESSMLTHAGGRCHRGSTEWRLEARSVVHRPPRLIASR